MTLTPEMEVAVKYGSHLPALLACIAQSNGPVLELGVGYFSTPHLHALCGAMNRMLISVEPDNAWREEFSRYTSGLHNFRADYTTLNVPGFVWHFGVAFIDHSPGGANRAAAFKALIEVSDYVVVHDAQKEADNFQAIEPMLAGLNWHLCTSIFPHTLCASKTKPIPEVLLGM